MLYFLTTFCRWRARITYRTFPVISCVFAALIARPMRPVFLSVYCMFLCTKRTFFKVLLVPCTTWTFSCESYVSYTFPYTKRTLPVPISCLSLLSLFASKLISICLNRAYDIVVSSGPSPGQRWGSHRVVRALQRLQARHRKHWVCGCDDCDLPTGEPPV